MTFQLQYILSLYFMVGLSFSGCSKKSEPAPQAHAQPLPSAMKVKVLKKFISHPVLGSMDAYYVDGGRPYRVTEKLPIGSLPFASTITIWTDPEQPSEIAISGAVNLVRSGDDFRAEVERRFFNDYITVTREEYLEYSRDPSYGITREMLPEIHEPGEIWSFLRPKENAVSIDEPNDLYPSNVAEVALGFSVPFDREHDFHIVFKNGKFFELTR